MKKQQPAEEEIEGGISVSSNISSDLEIRAEKNDNGEKTDGPTTCSEQNGGQEQRMRHEEEESELDHSEEG